MCGGSETKQRGDPARAERGCGCVGALGYDAAVRGARAARAGDRARAARAGSISQQFKLETRGQGIGPERRRTARFVHV